MHEAEQYLRNPQNPPSLHVIIGGKKRRLFINRDQGQIGIVAPKKKVCGYSFGAWNTIEKICYPRLSGRTEPTFGQKVPADGGQGNFLKPLPTKGNEGRPFKKSV